MHNRYNVIIANEIVRFHADCIEIDFKTTNYHCTRNITRSVSGNYFIKQIHDNCFRNTGTCRSIKCIYMSTYETNFLLAVS